jgi:hypothetical protein
VLTTALMSSASIAANHSTSGNGVGITHLAAFGGHQGVTKNPGASASSDPGGRGAHLAIRGGHLDVAAEAVDVFEFRILTQHSIEFLIAETPVSHIAPWCPPAAHQPDAPALDTHNRRGGS